MVAGLADPLLAGDGQAGAQHRLGHLGAGFHVRVEPPIGRQVAAMVDRDRARRDSQ
jgi:hypothetical protein